MSILRKKGQRALTQRQQKRANRNLQVRRAVTAQRRLEAEGRYGTRPPLERTMKGITGRLTPAMRDAQLMRGYR